MFLQNDIYFVCQVKHYPLIAPLIEVNWIYNYVPKAQLVTSDRGTRQSIILVSDSVYQNECQHKWPKLAVDPHILIRTKCLTSTKTVVEWNLIESKWLKNNYCMVPNKVFISIFRLEIHVCLCHKYFPICLLYGGGHLGFLINTKKLIYICKWL
jgi:hypothetical protein